MSTASDDGEGALAHEIEQILDSIPHHESVCTDIQCAMQDHKPHRLQAKAAIEALLVRAEERGALRARVDAWQAFVQTLHFCLWPKHQETVEDAVKHWKGQAEKVLAEYKVALSISPQGQGVGSASQTEEQHA